MPVNEHKVQRTVSKLSKILAWEGYGAGGRTGTMWPGKQTQLTNAFTVGRDSLWQKKEKNATLSVPGAAVTSGHVDNAHFLM